MRRLLYLMALSLIVLLVLAPSAGAQGSQQTVAIQDFYFPPAQITIQPGTTVTWTNKGKAPHTVTADDGSFDSERLEPGQSFSHTFQNPGTVTYHCEIHPYMKGSVVVSGSSASGKTSSAIAGGSTASAKASSSSAKTSSAAMAGGSTTSAKTSGSGSAKASATLPSTGGISPLAAVGAIGTLLIGGRLLARRMGW